MNVVNSIMGKTWSERQNVLGKCQNLCRMEKVMSKLMDHNKFHFHIVSKSLEQPQMKQNTSPSNKPRKLVKQRFSQNLCKVSDNQNLPNIPKSLWYPKNPINKDQIYISSEPKFEENRYTFHFFHRWKWLKLQQELPYPQKFLVISKSLIFLKNTKKEACLSLVCLCSNRLILNGPCVIAQLSFLPI